MIFDRISMNCNRICDMKISSLGRYLMYEWFITSTILGILVTFLSELLLLSFLWIFYVNKRKRKLMVRYRPLLMIPIWRFEISLASWSIH